MEIRRLQLQLALRLVALNAQALLLVVSAGLVSRPALRATKAVPVRVEGGARQAAHVPAGVPLRPAQSPCQRLARAYRPSPPLICQTLLPIASAAVVAKLLVLYRPDPIVARVETGAIRRRLAALLEPDRLLFSVVAIAPLLAPFGLPFLPLVRPSLGAGVP